MTNPRYFLVQRHTRLLLCAQTFMCSTLGRALCHMHPSQDSIQSPNQKSSDQRLVPSKATVCGRGHTLRRVDVCLE
ncbi:hypothetical protein EV401DRAFT_2011792 [Pisolithus croceorrhizus]|nr:hypothetical protein EV401DRAFT_2011792 [Pisolithus croceorrhizus]